GGFGVGGLQGIGGVPDGLIVGGQRAATRCDRGQFRVRSAPGLPSSKPHRDEECKNQQRELNERIGSSLAHTQFPGETRNACNNLHELRTTSMRTARMSCCKGVISAGQGSRRAPTSNRAVVSGKRICWPTRRPLSSRKATTPVSEYCC